MDLTMIRDFCLGLPHVEESVKWDNNLVFTIGGKMFCITNLEGSVSLSFKVAADQWDDLLALPHIVPAPYLARAGWVQLQSGAPLGRQAIEDLIAKSYRLVWQKLLAKIRTALPM